MDIEQIINHWACEIESDRPTRELYGLLHEELLKNGLGDCEPKVVAIALSVPEKTEPPKAPSLADNLTGKYKSHDDAAHAIAEVAEITLGADFDKMKKDYATDLIGELFHDDRYN